MQPNASSKASSKSLHPGGADRVDWSVLSWGRVFPNAAQAGSTTEGVGRQIQLSFSEVIEPAFL